MGKPSANMKLRQAACIWMQVARAAFDGLWDVFWLRAFPVLSLRTRICRSLFDDGV
jgi:hypothetical protein